VRSASFVMAATFGALPLTRNAFATAGRFFRQAGAVPEPPGPARRSRLASRSKRHSSIVRDAERLTNTVPVRARLDLFPLPSLPLVIKGPYNSLTYQGPQESMVPSPAWDITDT
jgi:hypothetical protein